MEEMKKILARIPELHRELCAKQIEREEVAAMLIVTFFANKNMFLLGEPGVSKTGILEIFSTLLSDGEVFIWTIKDDTKYTELFGDRYENSSGKMIYDTSASVVSAHITILDEIWKGNSKILNSLLSAMSNNRTVEIRGKGRVKIPNLSTFGASNELPNDVSLKALKDRFNVMMKVVPIQDNNNWIKFISRDYDRVPLLDTKFSLQDIELVRRKAEDVKISNKIYDLMLSMKNSVKSQDIACSDRRFDGSIDILKMSAFLNGRSEVNYIDTFLLQHMVWEIETDIPKVKDHLLEHIFGSADSIKSQIFVLKGDYEKAVGFKDGHLNDFFTFATPFENGKKDDFLEKKRSVNEVQNFLKKILEGFDEIILNYKSHLEIEKEISEHLFVYNIKNIVYIENDIEEVFKLEVSIVALILDIESFMTEYSQLFRYNEKAHSLRNH